MTTSSHRLRQFVGAYAELKNEESGTDTRYSYLHPGKLRDCAHDGVQRTFLCNGIVPSLNTT